MAPTSMRFCVWRSRCLDPDALCFQQPIHDHGRRAAQRAHTHVFDAGVFQRAVWRRRCARVQVGVGARAEGRRRARLSGLCAFSCFVRASRALTVVCAVAAASSPPPPATAHSSSAFSGEERSLPPPPGAGSFGAPPPTSFGVPPPAPGFSIENVDDEDELPSYSALPAHAANGF